MNKKVLTAVFLVAAVAFFAYMTTHSVCSFTAKLADDYHWTSATYEFIEGEEAELDISFEEDNKVKIKGPNEEMTVLITFKDDKNNTALYQYVIYYDTALEGNSVTLEPYEQE